MPEDKEPVQGDKPKAKMVPESDLFAVKKPRDAEIKRLKEELATIKQRGVELEAELKIAKMDDGDEAAVSEVKKYLLKRESDLNEKEGKLNKDLTSVAEREKEVAVKALASEHQVDIDAIKDADDPEKEALRIVAKRLTEKAEETPPPESVFESRTPGIVKKDAWAMSDEEFDKAFEDKRREALSKK